MPQGNVCKPLVVHKFPELSVAELRKTLAGYERTSDVRIANICRHESRPGTRKVERTTK